MCATLNSCNFAPDSGARMKGSVLGGYFQQASETDLGLVKGWLEIQDDLRVSAQNIESRPNYDTKDVVYKEMWGEKLLETCP
eukprot:1156988-Pelagomonas_calceolata.AAC.4